MSITFFCFSITPQKTKWSSDIDGVLRAFVDERHNFCNCGLASDIAEVFLLFTFKYQRWPSIWVAQQQKCWLRTQDYDDHKEPTFSVPFFWQLDNRNKMLSTLLYNTLQSRHMSADAAAGLWPHIHNLMESPFTDAVLKQRLCACLAAMTYWYRAQSCDHSECYNHEFKTAEEHIRSIEDLVKDLKSPTYVVEMRSSIDAEISRDEEEMTSNAAVADTAAAATAVCSENLPSAIRSALLSHQSGTKDQAVAWDLFVDTLIAEVPDLVSKKRRLHSMNPLKRYQNKTASKALVAIPDSIPADKSSFMGTKFHPAPAIAPIFTVDRMAVLHNVFPEKFLTVPTHAVAFNALVEDLRTRLQAGPAIKFVVDRKRNHSRKSKKSTTNRDKANSVKAVYSPSASSSMQDSNAYKGAIQVLAVLEGRLKQYLEKGGIRAECASLDKSGLATIAIEPADLVADVPTALFVVMATLEFSSRKAFTIKGQQQGGLNPALQYMLHDLEKHKQLVSWNLIFLIYPNESTVEHLQTAQKVEYLDKWMGYMPLLARFLKEQWKNGVYKCAKRLMLVPRRGGNAVVDSDGWNRVAGAWNNALRFIRLLSVQQDVVEVGHPMAGRVLFKVLKLTAGDQKQWAEIEGKGVDMDAEVFRSLVAPDLVDTSHLTALQANLSLSESSCEDGASGASVIKGAVSETPIADFTTVEDMDVPSSISSAAAASAPEAWLPWDGLLESEKSTDQMHFLTTRIEQLCALHSIPTHKWLGGPAKSRTEDSVKVHVPMICGVAVGPLSPTAAQYLKDSGFAGSHG